MIFVELKVIVVIVMQNGLITLINGVITTPIIIAIIKIVDISGNLIKAINTVVGMILHAPTTNNLLLNLIYEV